ncbi:MAG: four helix bundle protein [Acidobacteria bacterium]|nr:four helix bundle protein [Acidobacteriota bacterium]MCH8266287.1 four helix bundle protein [Acidobacteriota bacterium]
MAEREQKVSGGAIKHYKDLLVYQQAYRAALMVSKLPRSFPRSEQFELAHQMRRAARSIPANIAEGWARRECGGVPSVSANVDRVL